MFSPSSVLSPWPSVPLCRAWLVRVFIFVSATFVAIKKKKNNRRNYYDTLAKVFGEKGVSAQLPTLLKALPQNKRKLLQDVVTGLSKK